jgi:hypothetical protein
MCVFEGGISTTVSPLLLSQFATAATSSFAEFSRREPLMVALRVRVVQLLHQGIEFLLLLRGSRQQQHDLAKLHTVFH